MQTGVWERVRTGGRDLNWRRGPSPGLLGRINVTSTDSLS